MDGKGLQYNSLCLNLGPRKCHFLPNVTGRQDLGTVHYAFHSLSILSGDSGLHFSHRMPALQGGGAGQPVSEGAAALTSLIDSMPLLRKSQEFVSHPRKASGRAPRHPTEIGPGLQSEPMGSLVL